MKQAIKYISYWSVVPIILSSVFFLSCSQPENKPEEFSFQFIDPGPDTNKYTPVPPVESFENTKLRATLEEVYTTDQEIRTRFLEYEKKYGRDSKEVKSIQLEWRNIDSLNLEKVIGILDKYGWIGPQEIGEQANSTLWLVIQHSDPKTLEKYLPKMRRAVKENRAKPDELALLEDRVLLDQGKKQLFGSQLEMDTVTKKYKIAPIVDEINVNKRRAKVGLPPLEQYAKQWDIDYVLPKK